MKREKKRRTETIINQHMGEKGLIFDCKGKGCWTSWVAKRLGEENRKPKKQGPVCFTMAGPKRGHPQMKGGKLCIVHVKRTEEKKYTPVVEILEL